MHMFDFLCHLTIEISLQFRNLSSEKTNPETQKTERKFKNCQSCCQFCETVRFWHDEEREVSSSIFSILINVWCCFMFRLYCCCFRVIVTYQLDTIYVTYWPGLPNGIRKLLLSLPAPKTADLVIETLTFGDSTPISTNVGTSVH